MCRPVVTTAGGAVEPSDLPDHVVLKMLHREVLLTKAKLHALNYEHAVAERKLRSLKSQLRQVSSSCFVHFQLIPSLRPREGDASTSCLLVSLEA